MKSFPNSRLLITDTDSLAYATYAETEVNYNGKLKRIANYFDFSNIQEHHIHFNKDNKGQTGYFKDELKGEKMLKYVGLRPKLYAIHHMKKDHEKDSWERTNDRWVKLKGKEIKKIHSKKCAKVLKNKSEIKE